MNKFKTTLIILLCILVPVGVGAILFAKKKSKKSEDAAPDNADDSAVPGTATTSMSEEVVFPLVYSTSKKNNKVMECQQLLNAEIKNCVLPAAPQYNGQQITALKVDGYYGPKTAAVVKYLWPDTDGKTITQAMYNELTKQGNPVWKF